MNQWKFAVCVILCRISDSYYRKTVKRLQKEIQSAESGAKIAPRHSFLYEYSQERARIFKSQLSQIQGLKGESA